MEYAELKDVIEARASELKAEFNEEAHPRGEDGKFSSDTSATEKYNQVASGFGLDALPNDFDLMKGVSNEKVEKQPESLCYSNSLRLAQEKGYGLAIGVVMDKDTYARLISDNPEYISSSNHAWNVDNQGKIIDSTLNAREEVYIGKVISAEGLRDGSDVRNVLFRELGIKSYQMGKSKRTVKAEFDEEAHPRDEHGRFGGGGNDPKGRDDHPAITIIKNLDPDIKVTVSPSGNKIDLIGDREKASVWRGVGDGQWRMAIGNKKSPNYQPELVSSMQAGLEEAAKVVSDKVSQRTFQSAAATAKEGEDEKENKSLKATDSARRERFDDFLARAEEEGFINSDDADNLRTDYLNGDIADDDLPLLLEDAIDDDLDQDDVAESRNRLGIVALLGTLTARALLRDRLQSEFEGTVRDLATNDNIPDWQSTFSTAVSNNILDQALLGRGEGAAEGDVDDETLQAVSDVIQEQQGYLSRFADDRAASALVGDPMSEEEVAARSELYSGAGRTEFFAGAEDEEAEDGYVVDYVAVGDNATCDPCLQAEQDGPYLPGDEDSPYPGTVCDGHGRCRCERIMRYSPDEWAALMGKSRRTVKAEFSEEAHPRDEHGRFSDSSGGSGAENDSHSDSTSEDFDSAVWYHGTSAEYLESIKEKGIIVNGSGRRSAQADLYLGERGESVYVTRDPGTANRYANHARSVLASTLVLKIVIPAGEKLYEDVDAGVSARYMGIIPPSWIKEISIDGISQKVSWKSHVNSDTKVLYCVVITEPDDKSPMKATDSAHHKHLHDLSAILTAEELEAIQLSKEME